MTQRRKGFTLVEMLLAIVIFSLLATTVFSVYGRLVTVKAEVEAKQKLISRSHFLMEKLQVMLADYTIDYEEYYNRKMVGCEIFEGHCREFTGHGNGKDNSKPVTCSGDSCGSSGMQSYASYRAQFWDMKKDVDEVIGEAGDEDDEDKGSGPVAMDGDISDLYLISHDGTKRLWLRRYVIEWYVEDGERIPVYGLQQLQLQGVDAGYNHNFEGEGAFDGRVDTRWCDAQQGYECSGSMGDGSSALLGSYRGKSYAPAKNNDEGWVDLFGSDISVKERHIRISPDTDPKLAWAQTNKQVNPSVTISLKTTLSPVKWNNVLNGSNSETFSMPIQTTYDIKTLYR